ncbi:hypothetical protein BDA96_07G033400 [Sorghum bicolor]|uniref:F-box domain-containing protein n=2 Tax=Sorghum bicolor TaxID=4558 RepID=C5YMZ6_SORBI|nr:putative FBD-associated F-box protein At1g61330 [Sorghum bicolor]XP_021320628.1 putative FBD-associated F-box protein At1g61330 [Sorghum bicolor]XP_021320629.1 putative FBD-associated F-box protein At1g61330 [Sorghum bicolor]XP_021320630.1 putative FBD-associated F-box protein At1g61330 [Sorghum bicolor]XP_021320631.1 putative FBD-associated F-box protein At1g61330 [Sorghum bicolor]XP_021320632.1 putative FBD-associated F-box protein At1g61330 [Sorghum bicolor]EES14508.1 hypothetical prote|eukprot:XP_002445013.1 putative FBD-associated F-box protein At1g61330 [Sorghum bicolor]
MEGETAAKRRKLEHHRGLSDADAPGLSSFHMEDLPEGIQPLILSLLSLKEAARTSIVSRKWRMIWTRHPNLCFDGTKKRPNYEDCVKIERAKFIETVNSVVQQHSGIGLNKFSIRCSLPKNSSDHLDMWIRFAAAAKAKIIDINLWSKRYIGGPIKEQYLFPLENLGAQDGPFIQALFLTDISIKPHLDMRGFTKLRRLLLDLVHITGDLPGLLSNCCSLEDLELIACSGVTDLNIPHRLDKLRHLLISHMDIQMVDFHVTGLAHFEYKGGVIPIQLHGCSKLEKATITFKQDNKTLGHAFTAIPSISEVKVLNMHADMEAYHPVWVSQGHMVTTRPTYMFANLRHLTCEIKIFTRGPNEHSGLLQLAHYLSFAPQLETLQLHMLYEICRFSWEGEATGEEAASCMRRLDRLKTVYMSGFRCYRPQVELLCGILAKSPALEHVTLQPKVMLACARVLNMCILEYEIWRWARSASERFGRAITVVRSDGCCREDEQVRPCSV